MHTCLCACIERELHTCPHMPICLRTCIDRERSHTHTPTHAHMLGYHPITSTLGRERAWQACATTEWWSSRMLMWMGPTFGRCCSHSFSGAVPCLAGTLLLLTLQSKQCPAWGMHSVCVSHCAHAFHARSAPHCPLLCFLHFPEQKDCTATFALSCH